MPDVPYALVTPTQEGANRSVICTWGLPTAIPSPGNGLGNTPRPFEDLNGNVVEPAIGFWAHMITGQNGAPLYSPSVSDRSVQVIIAGGTGTVAIMGSNDGVNYSVLHDAFGNLLSGLVGSGIWQIMEQTSWIKPMVSSGGTGNVDVILVGKRTF
jgi:hypothetical protein